ncbi:heme-binding protein 2 [Denticeps clupeoides]|uniref:Heme-binding protein 1 n=1 Tax=Denticeps clupeoides TaxID=299321 RepID=A0AAY4BI38_9TELE|nr:heme-binding protein 2-like [Denticeps clupeoides]
MAVILTLLMALSVTVAQGGDGPSNDSSFCTEFRECLQFDLVCKMDEYEVRHYSPTRWVSTDAEAYFMGVGAAMAFRRLYQYITGANTEGVQIGMTAPVLVKIPEKTKKWEPAMYTLSFLLPSDFQESPPVPTNDKLYFTDMPDMDVYVRSYGGWMLSVTSRLHANLLTKQLQKVQASYNDTYHYMVAYDSPLKLLNRHNEVWYVVEDDPVCVNVSEIQTEPPTPEPDSTLTPKPELDPTLTPTTKPELKPTLTTKPELEPTLTPTTKPELEPTLTPTTKPKLEPTLTPTTKAELEPTLTPTA